MASDYTQYPRYVRYDGSKEAELVPAMRELISKDLSEPYSVYVYRYFLHQWGDLCFLTMDENDKIIGVVISKLEPHRNGPMRGYIAMLAVHGEHRGRGIATKLVCMSIDAMKSRDADEVALETEATNVAAIKLYERLGFLRSKSLHRYYLNANTAYRLVLYLNSKAFAIPTTNPYEIEQIHQEYLHNCLNLASLSPPKPTNFRVGAILVYRRPVDPSNVPILGDPAAKALALTQTNIFDDTVLSMGFTLELPGNTHAEQCCLAKYAARCGVTESELPDVLPPKVVSSSLDENSDDADNGQTVLYVTMEPCGKRLSGNAPCASRIAATKQSTQKSQTEKRRRGIDQVIFGVKEPETFVGQSTGCQILDGAGVDWKHIPGFEADILEVATAGHDKTGES